MSVLTAVLAAVCVLVAYAVLRRLTAVPISSLKGKVVVVTGASSGIGEAVAYECARVGAKLVLSARRAARLEQVREACAAMGAERAVVVTADMSKMEDCQALVAKSVEAYGAIDLLVLNAGVSMDFLLEQAQPKVAHAIMDTNFYGPTWTAQAALPYIKKSKGVILLVASMAALLPRQTRTFYSASKAAVCALFECLRLELRGTGAWVTEGMPGFVTTEMMIGVSRLRADGSSFGTVPELRTAPSTGEALQVTEDMTKGRGAPSYVPSVGPAECAHLLLEGAVNRRRRVIVPACYHLFVAVHNWFPALFEATVCRK
eukprot:TRINITY_DN18909_c0_g1_i1.p1 TRINITY_DN18909_c0_g1~~TRINITY_DN18909_c0_g1_i1.p1  ORF type:complete len:316 (-),score=93.53 TRINITY_DN18909_c0_g1_i1:44-991(-)